jgi:hypothetical protein
VNNRVTEVEVQSRSGLEKWVWSGRGV